MDYRIAPLDVSTRAGAVDAQRAAFMDDPLFTYAIERPKDRWRWLPHLIDELIFQSIRSGRCRVALDPEGDVVGALFAGPYPPSRMQQARMTARLALMPSPWVPPFPVLFRFDPYNHAWHDMHYKGAHDFVYMVGVHPDHQHCGVGRQLMATLLEHSDTTGVPIYLETQTERNVPFYLSMGFDVTEERLPHPEGPKSWGMFRRSRTDH